MRMHLLAAAALIAVASSAHAQTNTPMPAGHGGSAHMKSTWQIGGATISITYGRPALKGRAESSMMPIGKPWRTGADVASILTTDTPLTFGKVRLAPGSYTINTIPGETSWELLLGTLKAPDQWGIPYQPALEIGRVPMTLAHAPASVELVTFAIDPTGNGGVLRLEWGTVRLSTPFVIDSQRRARTTGE
jgi:hypothetical protein